MTDSAALEELGSRIRRSRLERNLSQVQLADEAGVGRVTVQRLEEGDSVSTVNLIRILRALGLVENLNQLVPEPTPSPIDQLRRRGRQRQRAGAPRARRRSRGQAPGAWHWGDEDDS